MFATQHNRKNWWLPDTMSDRFVLGSLIVISLLTFILLPLFISLGEVSMVFGWLPWYWFWGLTWLAVWCITLCIYYKIERTRDVNSKSITAQEGGTP